MKHSRNCDWHVDQYPWECTCGLTAQGMSAGTAKTAKPVEGEARQPGGEAMRPSSVSTPTTIPGEPT